MFEKSNREKSKGPFITKIVQGQRPSVHNLYQMIEIEMWYNTVMGRCMCFHTLSQFRGFLSLGIQFLQVSSSTLLYGQDLEVGCQKTSRVDKKIPN